MRRIQRRRIMGLAMVLLACGQIACDRGKDAGRSKQSAARKEQVEPTTPKPEYTFAAGLEEQYPDAVAFLRRFLETCLAGDYAGYRGLVTRRGDPESRGRFEKILNSLRSLGIESIEEIELPQIPPPAYLVVGKVEFLPDRPVALRHRNNNRIAILVLEEEGEMRMGLAPPALQPEPDEESTANCPNHHGPELSMATGRRLLSVLAGVALARSVDAQPAPSSTAPEAWELPDSVRSALAQVQDFTFNFDQPGFYAVLDFVAHSPHSPGFAQGPIEVQDWRQFLERPSDFRGRPVTVEGVVGHNKDPYTLPSHPALGPVGQIELSRADQPITCTLILTGSAIDIPLGAAVTVTSYFVMVRQYYGPSGRVQQAALLVAPGPTAISTRTPRVTESGGPDWRWVTGALVLGLLLTWVVLRHYARGGTRDVRTLRASHEPPVSLADDLAKWADDEPHEDVARPAREHSSVARNCSSAAPDGGRPTPAESS